jgi:uncharacterized membrane protein YedE/YeeE
MKFILTTFLVGILFGLGLGLSGMTQPEKVIGFLDIFGDWDPSLIFVMVGAIAVHMGSYRLIVKRPSPILHPKFLIPTRRDIDSPLIVGSGLFGIGWGLGGYCPGPGITSLSSGSMSALYFVGAMLGGMVLYDVYSKIKEKASLKQQKLA